MKTSAKKTVRQNYMAKITIIVNRKLARQVIEALAAAGCSSLYVEAGRTSVIEEKESFFSFLSKKRLGNDPVEIITVFVDAKKEDGLLNFISDKFDFKTPGRGTIFSMAVDMIKAHEICSGMDAPVFPNAGKAYMYKGLRGICCIVQPGEGDALVSKCLEMGVSVPLTTYGTGSGVRDKLGLLRITIPAEKELINLVLSEYDIDSVMELMISEGKLDGPGKGFVYVYPVAKGIIDTKISRGKTGQIASIEQIVSALDSIKGGIEWRKSRFDRDKFSSRTFLKDLVELDFICDEGNGIPMMKVAMDSGASGATICKVKYINPGTVEADGIPPNREMCKMIVGKNAIQAIASGLERAGGFSDTVHGVLCAMPVTQAYTYIRR